MVRLQLVIATTCLLACSLVACADEPLPGTKPLTGERDFAREIVDGADRFLLRKLAESERKRTDYWSNNPSRAHSQGRDELGEILGLRDERVGASEFHYLASPSRPSLVGSGPGFKIHRVRWRAVENIHGEGLLLEPKQLLAQVIAIPDCDQTPESLVTDGYVTRLAASGCRVVIPSLVSRRVTKRGHSELTDREYLYRASFELGRQLAGYELQKVLAVVDWFEFEKGIAIREGRKVPPIGILGWGEGGRLSLYAAALNSKIEVACVSGYFGPRHKVWNEPLDRNVFGLLRHLGDAEVASLKQRGRLILDLSPGPTAEVRTRGGAPYQLTAISNDAALAESKRIRQNDATIEITYGTTPGISDAALTSFAKHLGCKLPEAARLDKKLAVTLGDQIGRQNRNIREIENFNQRLLARSPNKRKEFLSRLDVSSVEAHAKTVESYREFFREEVIGRFDEPLLPPNVRTRKVFDKEKWTGYEVVLDVFPDVIAFGILLLPKDIKPNEQRPAVVCQHGLEGRPRNVIEKDHHAYHDYAAKLAERGFITFAPQNLYIFEDDFRTLQRKANPLGKTLFSIIVPQHQQIADWLAKLPQVDESRIAFYGLSYGGKSAMRIPPLVDRYCLSICSADFNDWVWKNATTLSPYSYVWTGEYEIFEWDLASNFNYSEMAALIAPRPFMVERGHFDGVAPDERVALEFAKVRHLYQAKLGIGDRCEIEFFVGPHTINGKGTFDFLHRHLDWPKRYKAN